MYISFEVLVSLQKLIFECYQHVYQYNAVEGSLTIFKQKKAIADVCDTVAHTRPNYKSSKVKPWKKGRKKKLTLSAIAKLNERLNDH